MKLSFILNKKKSFIPSYITYCNEGYINAGYPINLHRSNSLLGENKIEIKYWVDTQIGVDKLKEHGIDAEVFCNAEARYTMLEKFCGKKWGAIMKDKLLLINSYLNRGRDIVFLDADIVLLKNPTEYIAMTALNHDIIHQVDCDAYKTEPDKIKRNLCMGMFAARASRFARRYFHLDNDYDVEVDNDQDYIKRRRMQMTCLNKIGTFPREYFPNGAFWYHFSDKIKNDAYLVHFNHIIESEKINRMKSYGFWYV